MNKEQQDKLWNELSEEQRMEYRKEFRQETDTYHKTIKHCDIENDFEYNTGYSNGVATTLEELFGSHNLNPTLTYEDVARKLFEGKKSWCNKTFGISRDTDLEHIGINNPNLCTSQKQAEKLLVINKLLNVAKYLNGDWKPDWDDSEEEKFGLYIDCIGCKPILVYPTARQNYNLVYFRTRELAEQAIQILGEETIRLALSTDY